VPCTHTQHWILGIKCCTLLCNVKKNIMYLGHKTALHDSHFRHGWFTTNIYLHMIHIYLVLIKHKICAIQNNTPACCFRYCDSLLLAMRLSRHFYWRVELSSQAPLAWKDKMVQQMMCSKTWLIWDPLIWNFAILQILVQTYVPREKKFI
jgi:hypothetical protein